MAALEQKQESGLVIEHVPAVSREELILTAVKFLQNPKVKASAYAQRKSFLLGKGLTEAEVEEALRRSGTTGDQLTSPPGVTPGNSPVAINMPVAAMAPVTSVWVKLRDFFNAGLLIGGAIYALYLFYKKYIVRWIFGASSNDSALVTSSVAAMNDIQINMTNVVSTITELKELVSRTNEHLDGLARSATINRSGIEPNVLNTTEIKDEIRSLKSLLLSKNQFPPVPSGAPVLPAWQRQLGCARANTAPVTVGSKEDRTASVVSSDGVIQTTSAPADRARTDDAILHGAASPVLSVDETKAVYEGLNGIMYQETLNEGMKGVVTDEVNGECLNVSTNDSGSVSVGLGEVSLLERPDSCDQTNGLATNHVENGSYQEEDGSSAEEGGVLSVEHIGESLIVGQKTKVIIDTDEKSP